MCMYFLLSVPHNNTIQTVNLVNLGKKNIYINCIQHYLPIFVYTLDDMKNKIISNIIVLINQLQTEEIIS